MQNNMKVKFNTNRDSGNHVAFKLPDSTKIEYCFCDDARVKVHIMFK